LIANVTFNCSNIIFPVSYQWIVKKIDPTTKQFLQNVVFNSTIPINSTNLFIPDATLSYGYYQVIFQAIVSLSYIQTVSNSTSYIQVEPASYVITAFNQEINLSVDPLQSISFVPAFYSIDPNGIVDPKSLNYNYYCILINVNTVQASNFNQAIYAIQQNVDLTQDQINSESTCFKSTSKCYKPMIKKDF
jgi:hypothetical protein